MLDKTRMDPPEDAPVASDTDEDQTLRERLADELGREVDDRDLPEIIPPVPED